MQMEFFGGWGAGDGDGGRSGSDDEAVPIDEARAEFHRSQVVKILAPHV